MSYCLDVGDCLNINGEDWIVVQSLTDERRVRLLLQSARPRVGGESGTLTVYKRADVPDLLGRTLSVPGAVVEFPPPTSAPIVARWKDEFEKHSSGGGEQR